MSESFGKSEIDVIIAEAETGKLSSMLDLAQRYLNGNGVSRNDTEAFKWAKLAAENNSAKGYEILARAYEGGFGTDKDLNQAKICKVNVDVIKGQYFSRIPNSLQGAEVKVVDGFIFVTGLVTYAGDGIDIGDIRVKQDFNVDDLTKFGKRLTNEKRVTLVIATEFVRQIYKPDTSNSTIEAVVLHSSNEFIVAPELIPNRYFRYLIGYPLVIAWNLTLFGPAILAFFIALGSSYVNPFLWTPVGYAHKKDKFYGRLIKATEKYFKKNEKASNISVRVHQSIWKSIFNTVLFFGLAYIFINPFLTSNDPISSYSLERVLNTFYYTFLNIFYFLYNWFQYGKFILLNILN